MVDVSALVDGDGKSAKSVIYQAELEVRREQEELRKQAWAKRQQLEQEQERKKAAEKASRKARQAQLTAMLRK
jgi:hypothetical protein